MKRQEIAAESWQQSRLGKFTSSEIHRIFTDPKNKADKEAGLLSDGAETYIMERVAQILTGQARQIENNWSIEWGNLYEPDAVEILRLLYPDLEYFGKENPMFFEYGRFSGGSPDAVDKKIVFEIKCPENPANHVENLLLETVSDFRSLHKDYWCQLQMNIISIAKERNIELSEMSGRFVSYDPRIEGDNRMKILEIPYDPEFKKELDLRLAKVEKRFFEIITKLSI